MAAMITALTEFSNNGNSRTYTLVGHTASRPQIVLQKRRVPSGSQAVAEDSISVLFATVDSEGAILAQKASFEVKVRRPVNGATADVDAALAVLRDILAGDEFANTVSTQEFVK